MNERIIRALREVAEARAAINGAESPTEEMRARLTAADAALVAALQDDSPAPDPLPIDPNAPDPEERERIELRGRASVGRILSLRAGQSIIDGAEAEVAAAHGCAPGRIPVEMLFGNREDRAASAANQVQATVTNPIAPNIFRSALARELGISTPTVGAGVQAYPYISGNTSAAAALPGAADANSGTAATVSVATIYPARITGTVEWRMEDAAVLSDLEAALRANLRQVLEDAMDTQLLSGDGNQSTNRPANNTPTSAGLRGILTQYAVAAPSNADKAKADTVTTLIPKLIAMLDGIYAERFQDIRLFTSVPGIRFLKSLVRIQAGTIGAEDLVEYINRDFGGLRGSAGIPGVAAASGVAAYSRLLGHRTSRGLGGVAPIWQGIEAIVDQISGASKGETSVTLRMQMGGVLVLRSDAYTVTTLKTAAGS